MIVHRISNINDNTSFGMKFQFSEGTMKAISDATGLSSEELRNLPLDEATKLMKERGTLKEPSKLKHWLSGQYRKFGELLGLIEKHRNIYPYEF